MTREQAISLIKTTFEDQFDEKKFIKFILEIFKDNYQEINKEFYGNYIPEAYREFVQSYKRLLKYEFNKERIDVLIVKLERGISVERARSKQRNFVRDYLMGKFGSNKLKDAALVAFYSNDYDDWRFSFVKVEWKFDEQKNKIRDETTPAKRYSFLVGKNEKSHTAQKQLLPLLESPEEITVKKLEEAFEIETVTKEFFEYYRALFIGIKLELDEIIKRDEKIRKEFISKKIDTVNFTKKLLGQIVFLYFLQKKGWFGVSRDGRWGDGPKNFLRRLFNKEYSDYKNFFNDILEPLFYEALRVDRSYNDHYYDKFHCRIPFLNGGLFDPINNYDWVHTDILLPDELFSNSSRTREEDIGNGILDIFDRYNFTIKEEEPLEKEVALDPELLGKIYEKLNAIRSDNFDEYVKVLKSGKKGDEAKFNKEYGVYYTPREIVHYMCQESLINYLCSTDILVCEIPVCDIPVNSDVRSCKKEDIEKFVRYADLFLENEKTAHKKKEKIESGEQKDTKYEYKMPDSIIRNADFIDKLLADIKICDPAVGSGAFPIGMMHEIVKLRQLLSVYKSNAGILASESKVGILACESTDKNVCNPVDTDKNVYDTTGTDKNVCDTVKLDISSGDIHITRRNLPHWTKPGSIYWVTFRLADSLPKEKIDQWKEEYEIWLKNNPKPWNSKQWGEYNEKFGERFEKWLDSGYGSCILGRVEIREKLKECLFRFNKVRFLLHAVVIMPNHVHLLIEPFSGYSLSEILKGIKGTSANYINKLLNTTGKTVWMEESYDHIVRDEKEYLGFLRYIIENPIKANLAADRYYIYIMETMPKVTQTFMSVPPEVTQSFLSVDGLLSAQTGMSVLPYELKRHCIENSLYGVDIDPGAVEICKLRFWLSLIVDEEEFQNIKPLPNLDYKVVQGDSLLEVEKDLFNNEAFYSLELLKHQYFKETNPLQKQTIKKQIDNLIFKISKGHTQFDFEVYFSEVFHQKGGFDIVIANPPYSGTLKNFHTLMQKYSHFDSRKNSASFFIEKATMITNQNGIVSYIVPKSLSYVDGWKNTRKFILENNLLIQIVDVSKAFENVLLEQVIIIFKTIKREAHYKFFTYEGWEKQIKPIGEDSTLLCNNIGIIPIYTDKEKLAILYKMKRNSILLSSISETFRGLPFQGYISKQGNISILRGKNIGKYKVYGTIDKLNLSKSFLHNNKKAKKLLGPKIISQNIVAHVMNPYDHIIIMATLDDKGMLTLDTVMNTFIKDSKFSHHYILGILNSKLSEWFFYWFVYNRAVRTMHFDEYYIGKLPIKEINEQNRPLVIRIESLVSQILFLTQSSDYETNPQKQAQLKALEKQIDQLVYELYNLTEEEIKIIEGGLKD